MNLVPHLFSLSTPVPIWDYHVDIRPDYEGILTVFVTVTFPIWQNLNTRYAVRNLVMAKVNSLLPDHAVHVRYRNPLDP